MSQHFLLTRRAKTLSLAQVFRMTDAEAETLFRNVRWPETDGAPVCPSCGGLNAYECRRSTGSLRFRCRECKADFTVRADTSKNRAITGFGRRFDAARSFWGERTGVLAVWRWS